MKQIFLLVFTLCSFFAFAQKGTIRGTVFEAESGLTIIGGNVAIQGTAIGTSTDLDGSFSFSAEPGTHTIEVSYTGFQTILIEDVEVLAGKVTLLENIRMAEEAETLSEVVVSAKVIRTSEVALLTIKKKSAVMMDGISSAKFKLTGDGTAVEAAKRVTGVSIEGGKYVYIRGLGDRYSKTTLNGVDIPGLDPDRNTLQMDIFPTNLINNIMVSKNFTADMPADFTGGLLNVETKDFPEEKFMTLSLGTTFNPDMHFNSNYLSYEGGKTDFLGFDDGTRELPLLANLQKIPTPVSGAPDFTVSKFIRDFNPTLSAERETSRLDYSAGFSTGNQFRLKKGDGYSPTIGYVFSLSYKTNYKYYDDVVFGEYQRSSNTEENELTYANLQTGEIGERSVLVGALGGLAFKSRFSKIRLTAMHLQNGESRAGRFTIDNNENAAGQSGYIAVSDNLEYNQRSLTNVLLNGTHVFKESGWELDWRVSPTLSTSEDPDIRKTAFTFESGPPTFNAGAGGNPTRIWRNLEELNATAKFDLTKKYTLWGEGAKLKFGASQVYKERDYAIKLFNVQFFGNQSWPNPDPAVVLNEENLWPNQTNGIYYQSGNQTPNPNEYNSTVNNTGVYVSNEFSPLQNLKAILGVRAENYVQRHTGRDILWAQGNTTDGQNLVDEKVLESLGFFPSANLIFALNDEMNLRGSYSRTIARPSFKELSFAQIVDPLTNRIFNGALFTYSDWDGNLTETDIDNLDLRWELFQQGGQLFSVSTFYKQFANPIELVRIPEQQTSQEFQPRNVGDGTVLGVELEVRKNLAFLSPRLGNLAISTNVTFVQSEIEMTDREFNARKQFERIGENIGNTRDMAGQSPYVINAGLTYQNSEAGLDAGIFYNVKGETLQVVGVGLYPDVYTEPFHSVNFSINKRLGAEGKTTIDFKVSNLLGDDIVSSFQAFGAQDQIYSRFNPGRAFSFGISRNF